jgi:hypothetical protein
VRKKRAAGEIKRSGEVGCHEGEAGGRVGEAILKTAKYRAKGWRKRLGEAAESAFLAKAIQMGFGVSKPWGDSDRYDFVVDAGGRLWRVQVKSAYRSTKEGGYTVHAFGNENRDPYTAADVDVLVAYLVPEDAWYVVPISAFNRIKSMKLFPASRRRRSKHEVYREAWAAFMGQG